MVGLIAIIAILVIGSGMYAYQNRSITTEIIDIEVQQTDAEQNATRDKFQRSTDGVITLYAKKIKKEVDVQIKKNGNLLKSFTYEEVFSVDNSGNTWTGLPPSIDLSPDGMKVAYSDSEGLKILDLATGIIRTIRVNTISNSIEGDNVEKFVNPTWFPNGIYILYYQTAYDGSKLGIVDSMTGEYNDSALSLSPSIIEVIQAKGKNYIVYYTSQSNDIYGGTPGLFVAEISSVKNIEFIKLIDAIKNNVEIIKISYDSIPDVIVFEFYRDYFEETKTKYKGTISIDGSNFSETVIID